MAITPEDLITKSFKVVTEESGYDRNEVDDFLDELVVRTAHSTPSVTLWNVRLSSSLQTHPIPRSGCSTAQSSRHRLRPQDAAALLAMAQKVHDDYVAQGEKA